MVLFLPLAKKLMLAVLLCGLSPESAPADTLIMRNREQVKGVIVEDHRDRVVISTMDGEREVLKDTIQKIIYDREEQNLTLMGDLYQDRDMYKAGHHYYAQALRVNPAYKPAREGLDYMEAFLRQDTAAGKPQYIQMMNEDVFFRTSGSLSGRMSEEDRLRVALGITFKDIDGSFEVTDITPGSPARKAGLRQGDVILAAWGRSIRYMRPGEVIEKFLSPEILEIRLSISRPVTLELEDARGNYSSLIGARLGYSEMEGLVVEKVYPRGAAHQAGMKKGDILLAVDGGSVRYTPLRGIDRAIRANRGGDLSIVVQRDIVLWKKFQ